MGHIVIHDWMVNDLSLKGSELITYALIYGFSQDGESEYHGTVQYVAKWCGVTRSNASLVLSRLCEKGLLNRREVNERNQTYYNYSAVLNRTGCSETEQGGVLKQNGGCSKTEHHNITDNINTKDILEKKKYKEKKSSALEEEFERAWEAYPRKDGKKASFQHFARARSEGVPLEDILEGIGRYRAFITANCTQRQFIKMGSTWFGQRCWNDEYAFDDRAQKCNARDYNGQYSDDMGTATMEF